MVFANAGLAHTTDAVEAQPLLVFPSAARAGNFMPPSRKAQLAVNRWRLAYTLARNPGLIKHRRHGIATSGPTEADVPTSAPIARELQNVNEYEDMDDDALLLPVGGTHSVNSMEPPGFKDDDAPLLRDFR